MLGAGAYYQFRSARRLGSARNAFLLVTRLAALAIIVLLLLHPYREEKVSVPAIEKSVIFAVDTSASMAEAHLTGAARLDAARADLEKAGVLADNGNAYRYFTFSETAAPARADSLALAKANGKTTRIDSSVAAMLRMSGPPPPAALFLLSDGHDFDLVPPGETARRTRARDLPIFTIPYGTSDSARDVSVRIANYHPHTFLRQSTRLEAFVRTVGCPHEILNIDLLCDGKKVRSLSLETGLESFHTIHFDVTHEEAGQYEYSFRAAPVANERELSNNSAATYLNVISERIRILEIEGTPFWDSTFLRRSFARNDKFDIDSLVAFTGSRVRPIRSNPERPTDELKPPKTVDDLKPYNLIILGRDVERVVGLDGIRAMDTWVKDQGGAVIFARGQAWSPSAKIAAELEPIDWSNSSPRGVRLEVTPQANAVPAFRLLREVAAVDEFPEVIAFPATSAPKTLAATFSVTANQAPAVVYRRYGSGQTLSLGVGNLWRWVFNPKAEYDNNAYDRFWDQLALWMMANGGVAPLEGYSLRADAANLPLGETIRLRFGVHGVDTPATLPSIVVSKDDVPVTSLVLTPGNDASISTAEVTPRDTGRYKAQATTPDGKTVATHFIVFREDMEATETAMDRTYLEQLAKASGGRMLDPSEIAGVVENLLRETTEQAPLVRRIPLWESPWIYVLLCFILGSEWYARRRWGLT